MKPYSIFLLWGHFGLSEILKRDVCLVYRPNMKRTDIPISVNCQRPRLDRRTVGGTIVQAPGSNIQSTLFCRSSRETCIKIEKALGLMSRFLENVLVLAPIRLRVDFHSFCATGDGCNSSTTGTCVASQLINVKEGNLTFLYPQALFKQNSHPETPELEEFDMLIKINADKQFYFPDDYQSKQLSNQVNFIETLIHEVNHGLGFASSLAAFLPKTITPVPETVTYTYRSQESVTKKTEINFFFTIFDKHVLINKTHTPLSSHAELLQQYGPITNMAFDSLAERIQVFPHYTSFKSLNDSANSPHDLYFKISNGSRVNLETSVFSLGGTPSHIDYSSYENTDDSTMRFLRYTGTGIHDRFNRSHNWITSPYGPDTLAVFSTLGYKLNQNPKYENSMEYFYFSKQVE